MPPMTKPSSLQSNWKASPSSKLNGTKALVALIFSVIPHPAWMVVAGLLIPLPFALLGWRLGR